jgi:ankyrin repeat protein
LVERKAVGVNFGVDRTGTVIGLAATRNRHGLVRFLLQHGASANAGVESEGRISLLAAAAQYSDAEMVQILLDAGD